MFPKRFKKDITPHLHLSHFNCSCQAKSVHTQLPCLNSGSASFEGPGLWGLRMWVLWRNLVNRINLCLMGRSSLWSISRLHHQMFYPYVLISAAHACESDDLCHVMSPFSLFLSSFLGAQRILGYVSPRRIVAVHPPRRGRRKAHLWAAFGGAFELGQPARGVVM